MGAVGHQTLRWGKRAWHAQEEAQKLQEETTMKFTSAHAHTASPFLFCIAQCARGGEGSRGEGRRSRDLAARVRCKCYSA